MVELKDYASSERSLTFNGFLSKVFRTLFIGLLITTVVSYGVYKMVLSNYYLYNSLVFPVIIAQLVIGFFFSIRVTKMSKTAAWTCYILYSVTMGFTCGVLPIIYDGGSIAFAVLMTAVLFGCMAIIGHTTKVDLSKFSTIFMVGLVMMLVITLFNMFIFHSAGLDMAMNYVGVILFLGIIAWDMQKMRQFYLNGMDDSEFAEKMMILASFELYLDFINLFLRILEIFGRRDN